MSRSVSVLRHAGLAGRQLCLVVLLLLGRGARATRARKAAVAFKESNSTVASVCLYLLFGVALLPLEAPLADQPDAQGLVMGIGLAVCSALLASALSAPQARPHSHRTADAAGAHSAHPHQWSRREKNSEERAVKREHAAAAAKLTGRAAAA